MSVEFPSELYGKINPRIQRSPHEEDWDGEKFRRLCSWWTTSRIPSKSRPDALRFIASRSGPVQRGTGKILLFHLFHFLSPSHTMYPYLYDPVQTTCVTYDSLAARLGSYCGLWMHHDQARRFAVNSKSLDSPYTSPSAPFAKSYLPSYLILSYFILSCQGMRLSSPLLSLPKLEVCGLDPDSRARLLLLR